MTEQYYLPNALLTRIVFHLQNFAPEEACGLLGGTQNTFQTWIPIRNTLASPNRYRMDASQQLSAFLQFERNGQELLGIVHSHPNALDTPSQTDIEEAYYPEAVYFIFYRHGEEWQFKAYRIQKNRYDPVEIQLIE